MLGFLEGIVGGIGCSLEVARSFSDSWDESSGLYSIGVVFGFAVV